MEIVLNKSFKRVQASLSKASDRLETDYGFNNGHGMAKWSFIYSHQIGNDTEEFTAFKKRGMAGKLQDLLIQQVKLYFLSVSEKS